VRRAYAPLPLLVASFVGCLPYTVGTTARTVAPEETTRTFSHYFIPNAVEVLDDTVVGPLFGVDYEVRFGIDERSDVGIRLASSSGVVANYKRRLDRFDRPEEAGVALLTGAGIVNWGTHAHLEATLLASGRDSDRATVYGGLRVMQVVPISRGAVHDSPTAGGFLGVRIGSAERGFSPELGVFYDRSALDIRRGTVIFVPAVSLHGDILRALRGRGGGDRGDGARPRPRVRPVPRSPGWPRRN
jgi:hypothetical protein